MGRSSRITPCTIGEVWGKWTIIDEVGYTKSGHLKILARCECGTEREVYYSRIKCGKSKSCGKCNSKEDLTGKKFFRWTALEKVDKSGNNNQFYYCKCECGTEKIISAYKLKHGLTHSCGCYSTEKVIERSSTHRMSKTKIFHEWGHMRRRCLPDAECKDRYYDRGIKVCPEWDNSFEAFYKYVSKLEHYGEKGYSLDRINNNGNYEPGNVRWATAKEQCRNTENNVYVVYHGEKRLFCELIEEKGLNYQTIRGRLDRGWDVNSAFDVPVGSLRTSFFSA